MHACSVTKGVQRFRSLLTRSNNEDCRAMEVVELDRRGLEVVSRDTEIAEVLCVSLSPCLSGERRKKGRWVTKLDCASFHREAMK